MDHHASRFVDDDQIVVFVNNIDRNIFGREYGGGIGAQFNFDFVVGPNFV